jgi:hypothetical protein
MGHPAGLQSNYKRFSRMVCDDLRRTIIMELHGNSSAN